LKRIATIVTAFLYFAISSGLVVQAHYCMDRLVASDVLLIQHDTDACGKCGMKKQEKSKCCRDEVTVLKVSDSHQWSAYHFEWPVTAVITEHLFPVYSVQVIDRNERPFFTDSSPPGKEYISLQELYGVYRI
jgi:hypothetical protein